MDRTQPQPPSAAPPRRPPRTLAVVNPIVAVMLALAACAPTAAPRPVGADAWTPPAGDDRLPAGWRQEGEASWYGPNFVGRPTANGETFDPSRLTAAHRTLPFDTQVRVTNLDNGRSVLVRINDRGPFARGRVIDLSRAAGEAIGLIATGVAPVRIEPVGAAEGPRPVRIDARLSGYDVILPGVPTGSLLVLRQEGGASVLARAVDLEPPSLPGLDGGDLWASAGLAERLGPVVTVVLD